MAESTVITMGIVGCAEIACKLSRAIILAPNATLAVVASRSYDKVVAFAAANNFPPEAKVYGLYKALLDDPDIDAVYLPMPEEIQF